MAGLTSHMTKHLRSARLWLTRAEESFDKKSNIRGELDLFLAQAELQHAREANCRRQGRSKLPLIRHGLSFMLAASVAVAGFGAYWLVGSQQTPAHVQPVAQLAPATPQHSVNNEVNSNTVEVKQPPMRTEEPEPAAQIKSQVGSSQVVVSNDENKAKTNLPSHTEKENILQPDEMRKIVQVAGRSLRGQ